jgi:hypothetical protein
MYMKMRFKNLILNKTSNVQQLTRSLYLITIRFHFQCQESHDRARDMVRLRGILPRHLWAYLAQQNEVDPSKNNIILNNKCHLLFKPIQ